MFHSLSFQSKQRFLHELFFHSVEILITDITLMILNRPRVPKKVANTELLYAINNPFVETSSYLS